MSSNTVDQLILSLTEQFAKYGIIELTQRDEKARKIFNDTIFRISDISSFKSLVCNYFVPGASRAMDDLEKQIRESKYQALLSINKQNLYESSFETVRLAYVGLFHKFESFTKDVIDMGLSLTSGVPIKDFNTYAKEKFGFSFLDWRFFSVTQRVNWICICVKHYDGFPVKEPKPYSYRNLSADQRIGLSIGDFEVDADGFLKICPVYLQIMFMIANYATNYENYDRDFWVGSPEVLEIHDETQAKISGVIKDTLDKMKAMNSEGS